ncbi:D-alanyl-D-alanine carboxypeptidase [Streptomyces sp. NPDC006289]|uniref:D-alanyl-D-alanine carboxypeptidase family protein n=1 Tax=Streptomyces sp. NPDC006289 TaxID=3156744 RepID=UPI0033B20FF2
MAGESPGRSEQRKSSGTAEERDPRLAVFREPVAVADGEPGGGTTGAEADSKTAVFRVPRSADADAPEDAGASDSGSASDGAGPSAGTPAPAGSQGPAGSPAPSESPEGASRPRREAEKGTGRAPTAAEPSTAPEAAPDSDTAAAAKRPDSDSGSDSDAASDVGVARGAADSGPAPTPGTSGTPESDASEASDVSGTPDSDGDAGAEAEPEERPEAASGSGDEAGPAPTDTRLRAAVAAWVAGEPDEETAGQGGAAKSEDAKSHGGADSEAEVKARADDAEAAGNSATARADGPDSPDPGANRQSGPGTGGAGTEDSATGAGPAEGADAEVPAASATSDAADAPRVPRTREESSPADEAEPAADERGIDHPTAVFKAPRAERLDQPTTALKLPPKLPSKEKPDTGRKQPAPGGSGASGTSGAAGAPESPLERTSKFVPLRSDDVRPASPVVGPTVTPDITVGAAAAAGSAAGLTEAERTRQQPMPPRPPLDLLAELTNTPPPEETPVRTAVRRVKIWTPLVLLALIIFAIAQSVRPLPEPTLALSADPTYTFGGEKLDMPWPEDGQGAVEVEGVGAIGSYGKEKSAPIASMAKVMTAYVILQGHPITGKQTGEQIAVDKRAGEEASLEDESRVAIEEGQKYSEHQMLEMLMIPSGNNVARLLARWDAGTEKAFVEKMNKAADDLGMTKSTYTDPSGLKSSTVSTPADQIKLGKAVMQNDVFREIVNLPQADIPDVGRIYNNNYILLEPGVSGIKTGSSTPAGGNLLWTADTVVDGKSRRIIGAVMGSTLEGTLDAKLERARQNSLKLIKAAQKGVDSATVVKKGQVVGYVDNGFGVRTPVVATKDLKAVGWGGLEVELDLGAGDEPLQQTAKAGTVVGQVTVGTGTGKVAAPVALQDAMAEPGFGDKLTRIT